MEILEDLQGNRHDLRHVGTEEEASKETNGVRYLIWLTLLASLVVRPAIAWGTLPLITDDAETQGSGKFQIELGGEYDRDRETIEGVSVAETDYILTSILTYGISEHADFFVAVPYQWVNVKNDGTMISATNGISDITAGMKWRFFESKSLSLAMKPAVIIPSGDYQKGLGTGKTGYSAFLIISEDLDPWEVHLNFGYLRNENRIDERKDIWHASLAAVYVVEKHFKVCLDAGIETDRDATSEIEPSYLLGGVIFSLKEDFELSLGAKIALTRTDTDYSVMPGITFRF